ncbi:MAG: hypothetical protein KDK76_05175 [Chlamydiia bacterium]|nr:hypothetical protein [Chlamydiia bacterium]
MIVNKSFKEQVKIDPSLSKNSSEPITSKILEKKRTCSKNILAISFLSITLLSGCSVIGQTVASAADALKTDVQTQHDENFRIRRVRKALSSGDLLEAEKERDTLYASHWKCIANIEIATAKYHHDKDQALEIIKTTTEEIWDLSDANKRAMALLSLLKFELETKKDIPSAKETIKQTEKTISFILDDHARKMRRYGELQTLLEKHNHLLTR